MAVVSSCREMFGQEKTKADGTIDQYKARLVT
jgi:hypothetical protein